jgi:hypothetical protein
VDDSGGTSNSSDSISVVPEKVRDVGKYIFELAENLRTAMDSASKDVDLLINGSWTGASATDFAEGMDNVRDGGIQIMSALTGMAEKLRRLGGGLVGCGGTCLFFGKPEQCRSRVFSARKESSSPGKLSTGTQCAWRTRLRWRVRLSYGSVLPRLGVSES